jgi:uncharacterized membrane protein YfcA
MKNQEGFLRSILVSAIVILVWLVYMDNTDQWYLYHDNWFMSVTMVFGSFIAGASSEGGGAVAFPVMTLIYDITPPVARNFSLAIQSVGMTTASYIILRNRYQVEWKYLIPVSIGGIFGIILGTLFLIPLIAPAFVKMLFVTFWLSFGIVLFYVNQIYKRKVIDQLPFLSARDNMGLGFIGLLGGGLSALLGSGIDIFSFSYVTMRYHLSEKVATPTSVLIMALNSIVGFILHNLILHDFSDQEFNYWLVSIPVVVIGAPLGARFINSRTRKFVADFLYLIIIVQFIGAWIIIRPSGILLLFTVLIFLFGLTLFFLFARKKHWNKE